jgi:hypothetical protein
MSRIWKDKIFLACFIVALLSGGGLIYKVLFPFISSNIASSSNHKASSQSSKVSGQQNVQRGLMDKYPIVKIRPKSGKNEWRVGTGEEFDNIDLDTVVLNAIPGDMISISPGTYDFSFNRAFKKLQLIGEAGVILEVKKNVSHIPNPDSLVLEKIHIKFIDSASSSYLYFQKNTNLTLKQTKLEGTDFYFSLNDTSKIEAHDSQFVGVSFRVNESSNLELNNCYLEKAETFISMSGFSTVKIDKTHFTRFSNSAIYNRSRHTSLKGYDIKVDNGHYAFSGEEISSSDISHSSFSKLDSMASGKLKINCEMCEMSDIQR